ncbi:MAG: ATP-dependent Clp protease ATP-binding subunit [Paludibacteraceae bacterium]|nr:ATP-dependent Clp protease ATP-binding subunit [Paludibacteraceae bacterium]
MKKELLFYNQIEFESIKTLFKSLEYEVISLSYFLDDLKDLKKFTPYKSGVCVIDVSILGGGYYNTGAIQAIGENVFRLFTNEEIIYICDNRYHDQLKYELRYCFEQFIDIKEKYDNFFEQLPATIVTTERRHKKITDFTQDEFEKFFNSFRESLYGHEKFKDDFYEIAKSFRLFNKIGEHKVLSLFLLGESGVGKTEVARALYKCLGGEEILAKVNFGNYSNEFSLSSLIGSARGYIGSDDGEIFIRVRNTDVGVILIDEFEKSNATLFNFFLDVLESGKMVSSQAVEIDINGFIIIFTSNITKEEFPTRISPELRSRFDYKGHFTRLSNQDKRKYVEYRIGSIIRRYNEHYKESLGEDVVNYFVTNIPVDKYENMRDINKRIKIEFVKYIEKAKPIQHKVNILSSIFKIGR